MALSEIEIGDSVICQERDTGQFGVLHVEPDRIWVEFVGFGKRPSINADAPIYLHTAKGWVVSLFGNVDVSSALPFWRRGDVGTVHSQRIVSNLVLAGETPWLPDDRAESVSFRLSPDCDFLWPPDLAREIAERSDDTVPDRTILTVPVTGGSVRLAFGLRADSIRSKWIPEDPSFTVRFAEGAEPRECLSRIWYLRALFGLLSWRELHSEHVSIRRTDSEQDSYAHRVLTTDLKAPATSHKPSAITAIAVSASDEAERASLVAVMRVWLDRQTRWQDAVGPMCAALERFNRVSAEQALDACRWQEALPETGPRPTLPAGMDKVLEAATAKAIDCGLEGYVGQIRGLLGGIKGEPRRQRFSRLAHELNECLGRPLFDDTGVKMLMGTYDVRNKSAHGVMGNLSGPSIRELWGNLLAMEAFCAAQTMADLPLSESGRQQLGRHPLFSAYLELRRERSKPAG